MLTFIFSLMVIIAALVAIILAVISFFKEGKSNKFSIGSTIFSLVATIIGAACFDVPTPTIYPLNSDAKIYNGELEIIIEAIKFPFLETYYSLDGTNPEEGHIYKDPFTISESTTIVAENRFLYFWWSKPDRRTYKFETIPITFSGELDLLINDKLPSANELLDYLVFFIILVAIIYSVVRKAIHNIRDQIRNFFNP